MIGRTLSTYIATHYLKTVVAMLLSLLVFIVIVDFVEQLRKSAERPEIPAYALLQLSALKAPIFMDKAFPFACLFAAMITLTQLNQKLELVVARAAGVSAWQFLLPVSAASVAIGLFAAFVYNPVAITSAAMGKTLETRLFDKDDRSLQAEISGYWLRQDDEEGSSVINARIARDNGQLLDDIRVLRFDGDGDLYQRIDAKAARFNGDSWQLEQASVVGRDARPVLFESYEIDTSLTVDTLAGVTARPDETAFWNLRSVARLAQQSGSNPDPYFVQFHSLLSLPFFMVAMVVIAATVSLRFVRFGQIGRMVLGGILAGFVLYTATKLVISLGNNGIVPPVVAAWAPCVVAIMFGMSILLHQEDG